VAGGSASRLCCRGHLVSAAAVVKRQDCAEVAGQRHLHLPEGTAEERNAAATATAVEGWCTGCSRSNTSRNHEPLLDSVCVCAYQLGPHQILYM
jgi:hypothetical protein